MEILQVKSRDGKHGVIAIGDKLSFDATTASPNLQANRIFNLLNHNLSQEVWKELCGYFGSPIADNEDWKSYEEVTDFSQIKLVVDYSLTSQMIDSVSNLLGYALRAHVCVPEGLSQPEINHDTKNYKTTLIYNYDSTKSPRDDVHFEEAFEMFYDILEEGSPIRLTDRAGRGTKGTRLVSGLGFNVNYTLQVK